MLQISHDKSEMRILILNKLMFVESITYGELQKGITNHDLFNYHLKELVEKEFVQKQESIYSLTLKGRQFVSHMEEDGAMQKQFKVSMLIKLLRYHNNKWQMLLFRRLKHPHFGYIGVVTGKLKWGESLETNLERELKEELEVKPLSYQIIGLRRELFRNEAKEITGDSVFFVIVVDKFEGEPLLQNIEGEYFWHNIDEILNLDKIFKTAFEQGIPHLKRYLSNKENYSPYIIENFDEGLKY